MGESLSYVIVTPYTIAKSRTGGVFSRLLSQTDLELVGAQIITPDQTFCDAFAANLRRQNFPNDITLLADYVEQNMGPSGGRKHRSLLMLFRGENAFGKLSTICGHLHPQNANMDALLGETIRDTYADLITSPDDPTKIIYFEPAVMTPRNQKDADEDFRLFSEILKGQENIIRNIEYPDPSGIEQTLVIIKPDNWTHPSSKPGTIIDMFSRTGMRIIGIKVHRFSLEEALEFYGPVEKALQGKLAPVFGKKAKEILEQERDITLDAECEKVPDRNSRRRLCAGSVPAHSKIYVRHPSRRMPAGRYEKTRPGDVSDSVLRRC